MFSSLGLFSRIRCPDEACHRVNCPFTHQSPTVKTPPAAARVTQTPAVRRLPPGDRPSPQVTSSAGAAHAQPQAGSATARTKDPPPSGATPSSNGNGLPTIPLGPKFSPQPLPERQKSLRTLYTQYMKVYDLILPLQPGIAHDDALRQEQEISGSTNNLKAYKLAIHQAAVSISRRPHPDSIPHRYIGTVKESRLAVEAADKAEQSRLTTSRVLPYCEDTATLMKWGYPDANDALLKHPTGSPLNPHDIHTCDRCKQEFRFSADNESGECLYHHGKLAPSRQEARRVWLYTCCGKDRGAVGCEKSLHVFSFRDNDHALAAVAPFASSQQIRATGISSKPLLVAGMDCEMIYTTTGSSLARVSVVDEDGAVVLDEFVRQTSVVLDYNTRYSGVGEEQLQSAVMDLEQVRAAVCSFVGPETVLVGHGLENDLRALRLLHQSVIDTALLFPHDKGPPFRRALRDLVKEKLGYFIQERISETGHSSAEDARAAIELLKWKVRNDNLY